MRQNTPSWAHPRSRCVLDLIPCIFHSPTAHKMSEWPYNLRETGLVERMCAHGVGHPDPDSAAFMDDFYGIKKREYGYMRHGCDGCCS